MDELLKKLFDKKYTDQRSEFNEEMLKRYNNGKNVLDDKQLSDTYKNIIEDAYPGSSNIDQILGRKAPNPRFEDLSRYNANGLYNPNTNEILINKDNLRAGSTLGHETPHYIEDLYNQIEARKSLGSVHPEEIKKLDSISNIIEKNPKLKNVFDTFKENNSGLLQSIPSDLLTPDKKAAYKKYMLEATGMSPDMRKIKSAINMPPNIGEIGHHAARDAAKTTLEDFNIARLKAGKSLLGAVPLAAGLAAAAYTGDASAAVPGLDQASDLGPKESDYATMLAGARQDETEDEIKKSVNPRMARKFSVLGE
jgi:hypothetical protein